MDLDHPNVLIYTEPDNLPRRRMLHAHNSTSLQLSSVILCACQLNHFNSRRFNIFLLPCFDFSNILATKLKLRAETTCICRNHHPRSSIQKCYFSILLNLATSTKMKNHQIVVSHPKSLQVGQAHITLVPLSFLGHPLLVMTRQEYICQDSMQATMSI